MKCGLSVILLQLMENINVDNLILTVFLGTYRYHLETAKYSALNMRNWKSVLFKVALIIVIIIVAFTG